MLQASTRGLKRKISKSGISPQFKITEISGDQFPDLAAAQRATWPLLAADLAVVLRHMIDAGELEIKDGCIVPKG